MSGHTATPETDPRFVNCEACQTEGRVLTNDGGPDDVDHGVCPVCGGARVVEVETTPVDMQDIADLVAGIPLPSAEQMRVGELALDAFYDGTKDADVQGACAHVYRAMRALEPQQLTQVSAKAREWAAHYTEASDGRNTFILFAEWVESLAPSNSHAELVKALEEIAADHKTYKGHGDYDEGPHPADICQQLARAALATLTARKVG